MDERPSQSQATDLGVIPGRGQADPARTAASDPVLRQLDIIIENVTSYATPVLREIAARAAELAAKAGQAAGPMAYKAAERTGKVGDGLATKGRALATDLRRDAVSPSMGADADRPSSDDLAPAP
jgi:hypothetical protein